MSIIEKIRAKRLEGKVDRLGKKLKGISYDRIRRRRRLARKIVRLGAKAAELRRR